MTAREHDVVVIGGGLVGAAIAYGLAGRGLRVALLDEGDVAYRASRGNFALVWVQSKGLGMPAYAHWTVGSARAWSGFAEVLQHETGIDVAHRQPGGFTLALSEAELGARVSTLKRLHNQPEMVPYDYEVMDRSEVERHLPEIGPDVVGATYCALDGHTNSLRLLRALHAGFRLRGGTYLAEHGVQEIQPRAGNFEVETAQGVIAAGQVVLAAGIDNRRLAPMVGLEAPVRPQRGQIIVTEKTAPFLSYPTVTVRQTDEGGVMIGDAQEETGLVDQIGPGILSVMAQRAVRMFPKIASLNVVRSWAAFRVMSQDGFPIYDQSKAHSGAFLATCHSGVTLAAAHVERLAPMIAEGNLNRSLAPFSARRFHVPATA